MLQLKARLALGAILGLLVVAGAPASAKKKANVMPPNARVHGLTMGEWAARWWQWAYSIPAEHNPLLDETGADAAVGQTGNVWFLGGVLNVSGIATRDITVPTGTFLFFPIMNFEADSYFCVTLDPPLALDELRHFATRAEDSDVITALSASIDGVPVADPFQYREQSPVFSVSVPSNNIACGITPGTYGPVVDNGYYLMVPPLSPGNHTIEFAGTSIGTNDPTIPFPLGAFSLHITYHIQVAPGA